MKGKKKNPQSVFKKRKGQKAKFKKSGFGGGGGVTVTRTQVCYTHQRPSTSRP